MNTRALLLAASLVANVILLLAVTNRSMHWTDRFASAPSPSHSPAAIAPTRTAAPPPIDPQTWSTLTSGEISAVGVRLKTEGFPVSLQRAILAALVAEQYQDRHRAIAAMIDAAPWWRGNLFSSKNGAKILAARQQLQREEKEAVERLLGADSGMTEYVRAQRRRQYGELAPEKLTELARINADYSELINEVRNAAQNILLPEDRQQLALLEREKRADIARLLTPEELFEYDLRSSASAATLRSQLTAFNPTEEEFRALFKLQQAFDARYGGDNPDLLTPEQRRARSLAQSGLIKQAASVLPPERYAELREKADPMYVASNAFVTRMQLPPNAIGELVAVQKDILRRASEIRADATLSPGDRAIRLSSLTDEAALRLSPTLGPTGLAAYKQSVGSWINYLKQPPTPPSAPKP